MSCQGMLALLPNCIDYCATTRCTPTELHAYIAQVLETWKTRHTIALCWNELAWLCHQGWMQMPQAVCSSLQCQLSWDHRAPGGMSTQYAASHHLWQRPNRNLAKRKYNHHSTASAAHGWGRGQCYHAGKCYSSGGSSSVS